MTSLSKDDPLSKTAVKWRRQSEHDLRMGGLIHASGGYDIACFLAQQAAEKLVKALHVLRSGTAPKTHDLGFLGRGLGLDPDTVSLLNDLSGDYAAARYPDVSEEPPCDLFDAEVAARKLELARIVFGRLRPLFSDEEVDR